MRDFFHRYVFHNLGLKLISLALAVGVWLAVARDPVAEVAVDVAIEFHNIPQNLEISSDNIPRAQIRLRGPERVVRRLQPSDVYAEIELNGLRPGERTFDLTAQQIHEPSELEVVQVVPSQVHLMFDTRLTRQVPVQPRVVGNFAPGYGIEPDRGGSCERSRSAGRRSTWRRSRQRSPTRLTSAGQSIVPPSPGTLTSPIP